jgi:ribosome-associated toxin RatA of RatAB toxin-antitoxin module
MPKVEKSIIVQAAPEQVYAAMMQVDQYPSFLPYVKNVQVLDRTETPLRMLLEWTVNTPGIGMDIKWQSWHEWWEVEHRCTFRPHGDAMVSLNGEWQIVPEGAGSRVNLRIDYETKVPPIFAGMAQKALNEILDGWMTGIQKKAEAGHASS